MTVGSRRCSSRQDALGCPDAIVIVVVATARFPRAVGCSHLQRLAASALAGDLLAAVATAA